VLCNRTRRGIVVALGGKGKSNRNLGLLEKRLDIELNIGKHILQISCGQRILEVFHTGTEAFTAIRGIDVVLEHGILIVQEVIVDLGFLEQSDLGPPDLLGLQVIVHGLPLLPHNTKVLDEDIQTLRPIVVESLCLENPEFRLFGLLQFQILIRNHIVGIPDLLKPAAQRYAALIHLNGLLFLPEALKCLGEIEMGSHIRGLFYKLLLEHLEIPGELVSLAATVVLVIDPELGIRDRGTVIRSVPVLMGGPHTLKGLI